MQIGLFGFGTVGQGFYRILAAQNGASPGQIVKICIRNADKKRPVSSNFFTTNPDDILADPHIRCIVEATDSISEAFEWTKRALLSGKMVVSANKAMLARFMPTLLQAEREGGGRLLHEAAACGSIPIFRQLRHFYRHDEIRRIEGVFNGTTNFILNRMTIRGDTFEEALAEAQSQGFAESNPALDIEGTDPAAKLSLLIARSFGLLLGPDLILRFGIGSILPEDIAFAETHGRRVRLLNRAEWLGEGRKVCAWTLPAMISADSPYYALPDAYNLISVRSRHLDEMIFGGQGAGAAPTGYAILSDVADDMRGWSRATVQAADLDYDQSIEIYIRTQRALDSDFFLTRPQTNEAPSGWRQYVGRVSIGQISEATPRLAAEGGFVAVWAN